MSRHRRPQGFKRTDRIGDHLQRELATLIRTEVKDPRLGMVTIQEVRVSRDLSWADVYFTLLGVEETAESLASQDILNNAAGFLRTCIAKDLNTRTTPRLRFHYDHLPEEASRMEMLIREARAKDEALREPEDSEE